LFLQKSPTARFSPSPFLSRDYAPNISGILRAREIVAKLRTFLRENGKKILQYQQFRFDDAIEPF
jgi:hypothetical protein